MKGLQSLPGLLNLELTDRSWAIRGVELSILRERVDHKSDEECAAQEKYDHRTRRCARVVGDDESCHACDDCEDDGPEVVGAGVARDVTR